MLRTDATDTPSFAWDKRSGRYRYAESGRYLSETAMNAIAQRRINAISSDVETIGRLLVERKLSLATWQGTTSQSISELLTWNYTITRGGLKAMTNRDYLRLQSEVRRQLGFLDSFARDIQRGYSIAPSGGNVEMTIGRFQARLKLYLTGVTAKSIALEEAARDRGAIACKRVLGATDRHCADCVAYAALGVQAIGVLPQIGDRCLCKSACKCQFVYLTAKDLSQNVEGAIA